MKIVLTGENGVAVLRPEGKLMGGPDTGELDKTLYLLLESGAQKVVLDLGKTDWINSSGIAILIHHWKKFREANAQFHLANASEKTQHILAISHLCAIFHCYSSLDDAIAAFK